MQLNDLSRWAKATPLIPGLLCASGALADPLPDYAFYKSGEAIAGPVDSGLVDFEPGTNLSLSETYFGTTALVRTTGVVSPAPNVSSFSRLSIATNNASGSAYGTQALQYSLRILGPVGLAPVLVQATGAASLSDGSAGHLFGSAEVNLLINPESNMTGDPALFVVNDDAFVGIVTPPGMSGVSGTGHYSGSGTSASIGENQVYLFQTNTIYDVTIYASTNGHSAYNVPTLAGNTFTASASVDPTFTLLSNLYTLELSPGVGNGAVSGVPEPATWALMLCGFGLAAGALRMRRRPCIRFA